MGSQMLARLGAEVASGAWLEFKLRRREAVAGTEHDYIPFHRDYSLAVVNVALNDNFDGAKLIFAVDKQLSAPVRTAGDATAHECTMVHGVSCLAAGVRYNLYAVFDAAPAAAA